MNENIPKIELNNLDYEEFVKENKVYIWKRTIDGIEKLLTNADLKQVTVFIVHGETLSKPKEFIIKRDQIDDNHLEKAMKILQDSEEYEYCAKIININKLKGK